MRSTRHAKARSRLRLVATAVTATALLAACTSSDSGGSTGAPLPGITESNVKVGYIIVDTFELNKTLGLVQANYGDVATISKGIQAVVDWANQNGGAGNRTIEANITSFNGALSSPETVQATCAELTQDKQVFAAVMDGQYQDNSLPCYYGANTLMLDQTVTAHDQTQFEQYRNYLWSPTQPEYSSFLVAELETLKTNGFFEGSPKVQLLTSGDEVSRRVSQKIAEPWLAAQGITNVRVDYIDSTNTGTLGATSKTALQAGKAFGATRVLTVGGARIAPVALADAEAQDYEAIWSISTVDNPLFIQNNPDTLVTQRRVGMTGLGFNPPADVSTDKAPAFPDPSNPAQQQCYDIINAAGGAPPLGPDGQVLRENWRLALAYCDATMMLKQGLDKVGGGATVTAQQFADGIAELGSTLRSSSTFGSSWGPNVFAGSNMGRAIAWNEDCLCFDYFGDMVTFQPQQAAATVAPSVAPGSVSPSGAVSPGAVAPSDAVSPGVVSPGVVSPTVAVPPVTPDGAAATPAPVVPSVTAPTLTQ
jgi:hypothetical protein